MPSLGRGTDTNQVTWFYTVARHSVFTPYLRIVSGNTEIVFDLLKFIST